MKSCRSLPNDTKNLIFDSKILLEPFCILPSFDWLWINQNSIRHLEYLNLDDSSIENIQYHFIFLAG